MRRHPLLRYAIGLYFATNLLVFPLHSAYTSGLSFTASSCLVGLLCAALFFQRNRSNINGIDRLNLTGCKIDPGTTQLLYGLRQAKLLSDAHLDSHSSFFAAPGVER